MPKSRNKIKTNIGFFFLVLLGVFARSAFAKSDHVYEFKTIGNQGISKITVSQPKDWQETKDIEKQFQSLKIEKKVASSVGKQPLLRVVVVGDTGCRLKDGKISGGKFQNCMDPEAWPFEKLMDQVAKEKPDLIIHVGDYHYRESCSQGKAICDKYSDVIGYGWPTWEKDFFQPAKSGLSAAPWLLVRGNHEDCDRAFLGYKHLLTEQSWTGACLEAEDTQFISWDDVLIVNLDTSGLSEIPEISSERSEKWTERFRAIEKEIDKRKPGTVWLATHKPTYGFAPLGHGFAPVNVNLKKYFESSQLKKKIHLLLAGHVHLSSLIQSEGPLQVIAGNGGTSLDELSGHPEQASLGYSWVYSEGGKDGFGYTLISRSSTKSPWVVEVKNLKGVTRAKCSEDKSNFNSKFNAKFKCEKGA